MKYIAVVLSLFLSGCSVSNYHLNKNNSSYIYAIESIYVTKSKIEYIKKKKIKANLTRTLKLKLKLFKMYSIDLLTIYRKININRRILKKNKIYIKYSYLNYKNKTEEQCFIVDNDLNKRIVLDYKVSCF